MPNPSTDSKRASTFAAGFPWLSAVGLHNKSASLAPFRTTRRFLALSTRRMLPVLLNSTRTTTKTKLPTFRPRTLRCFNASLGIYRKSYVMRKYRDTKLARNMQPKLGGRLHPRSLGMVAWARSSLRLTLPRNFTVALSKLCAVPK